MDVEFYSRFAQRARELADKADPFTKRRLLELAKRYEAKLAKPSAAMRNLEQPLPSRTAPMVSYQARARHDKERRR